MLKLAWKGPDILVRAALLADGMLLTPTSLFYPATCQNAQKETGNKVHMVDGAREGIRASLGRGYLYSADIAA